ncbi:trace amine-associated receptor 7g-like [Montipora foliosa]|uniref:trace amine-associated receptor 7g-like n=1 Tax=Montipora foliosa TaxID=591990 RepID=UPI0035F2156A
MNESHNLSCFFLPINWDYTKDSEVIVTNVFACVLNSMFSVLTCCVNFLVLYAIRKSPCRNSPSFILLCCLALSDLLVGAFCQPFYVGYKIAELIKNFTAYCPLKMISFISGWISSSVSFLTLALISIDRLLVLTLHLRYNAFVTVPRVTRAVLVVWITCICAVFSRFWIHSYWIAFPMMTFLLTYLVTALCTLRIFHIARRHQRQINDQTTAARSLQSDAVNILRCKKSAVTVLYVYALFLIFYLPLFVTMIVHTFIGYTREVKIAYNCVTTVIFINSFLNPLVYCWRIREIRRAMKRILQKTFSER